VRRPRLPRPTLVMLPNGFTLANLFCGIYAIILATKGEHSLAVRFILVGAMCDAMDGRVARATGTGSPFGAELDSLVDAISFGLAPALMMYFAVLHKDNWDWIYVFLFSACAVMRLARFNVEQAGRAKKYFRGLPSPAAGGVLATYYWFSQTPLYNDTILADLPWYTLLRWLMATLAFLMISNVPYPAWPTFSLRTVRGAIGLAIFVALGFGLIFLPKEFFFPVGISYVLFGVVAAVLRGLTERQPGVPEPNGEEFEEETDEHDIATLADELEDVEFDSDEPAPRPARAPKPPRPQPQPRQQNRAPQRPPQTPPSTVAPATDVEGDGDDEESGDASAPGGEQSKRRRRRRRRPRGGPSSTDREISEDSPE
jgi:CDP-diacylglycerol--serine O-phosphatidyltransferase